MPRENRNRNERQICIKIYVCRQTDRQTYRQTADPKKPYYTEPAGYTEIQPNQLPCNFLHLSLVARCCFCSAQSGTIWNDARLESRNWQPWDAAPESEPEPEMEMETESKPKHSSCRAVEQLAGSTWFCAIIRIDIDIENIFNSNYVDIWPALRMYIFAWNFSRISGGIRRLRQNKSVNGQWPTDSCTFYQKPKKQKEI